MDIENNKEEVPFGHYEELFKNANAEEMASRSGAKYEDGKFYVNLLGTEYVISHPAYEIAIMKPPSDEGGVASKDATEGEKTQGNSLPQSFATQNPAPSSEGAKGSMGDSKIPLPMQTFLLRYLLEGKKTLWEGSFKTFREMPWGELYIKPYTGRVLTRAAFTFGTRVAAFKAACEKMGARKLSHGDAGYEFQFLPGFLVQIMVWEGDDEFPPNAQVLYSDNFESGFAPEDRVVVGDILITIIKGFM